MKKIRISLTVVVVLLIAGGLWAQERFSAGPRAGVNFSKLVGDDVDNAESSTGLVVGVTGTYSINERTGITADLIFSGEGSDFGDGDELNLSYLRLPIFFDFFFRDLGDRFRPKVYAGIQPGLLFGAQINDEDAKDAYNSFDFGVGAGLGFNFRIAETTWLNTDFRYLRGLTDVVDAEGGAASANNQSLQLTLGVAFGLW